MKNFKYIFLCFALQFNLAVLATNSFNEQAQELLKTNDINKDGKLAPNEVDFQFRLRRFKTVDANGNGYLDQTELAKSFQNAELARQQRIEKGDEGKSTLQKFIDNELNVSQPITQSSDKKHTVQAGESIYSIAKKYGVTQTSLKEINNITNESRLSIGKILLIPNK